LHSSLYPGATKYDTVNYDTISSPMITGGSPANVFAFEKYKKKLEERRANPFRTNDLSHEKSVQLELAFVGPGMHSPKTLDEIGGSDLERKKATFYSKLLKNERFKSSQNDMSTDSKSNTAIGFAKKFSSNINGINVNSNSTIGVSNPLIRGTNPELQNETSIGGKSFASSTIRFGPLNIIDKRDKKLPGPGYYHGHSGVNQAKLVTSDPSQTLIDSQWNNKSRSVKYNKYVNAMHGLDTVTR